MNATRPQYLRRASRVGQRRSAAPMIDKYAIVPLAACVFSVIVLPLFQFFSPLSQAAIQSGAARSENRIFWPIVAVISILLAARNRARLAKLTWPPHIICLYAFVSFAGASALWAFDPKISFTRFVQEGMVVISIVLPAMLAARTADIMRGLFLCVAFALFLNVPFVLSGTVTIVHAGMLNGRDVFANIGSPGYFSQKNELGECAAIGVLLSLHEIIHRGWRRALGIIGIVTAIYVVFVSNSKTALGLALIAPLLSGFALLVRRTTGISVAIILLSIPLSYVVLSSVSHYNLGLLSYKIYGDPTFTGRTIVWDFVQHEIDRRPLLGWGYESFWLVPGSPASEANSWVETMPDSQNGYYETMLNLGYLGLAFLLVLILTTLHAIGRVANRDPVRAWLVLSLALYVILHNFLEALWMRGFTCVWLVFLIVVAEIGRNWQPLPSRRATYKSRKSSPGNPVPSLSPQGPLAAH